MLIEVTEIHPPKIGGKVSRIVAADGQQYEIWPDKLDGVAVGQRYEVDIKERQYNERVIKSIQKIMPAASPVAANSKRASPSPGEAEFAGRTIAALIIKGEISGNHIAKTTARRARSRRQTDPTTIKEGGSQ
jgi:hypothetical protein